MGLGLLYPIPEWELRVYLASSSASRFVFPSISASLFLSNYNRLFSSRNLFGGGKGFLLGVGLVPQGSKPPLQLVLLLPQRFGLYLLNVGVMQLGLELAFLCLDILEADFELVVLRLQRLRGICTLRLVRVGYVVHLSLREIAFFYILLRSLCNCVNQRA